jgi:integrase
VPNVVKKNQRVPVPIGAALAARLRHAAGGRGPDEPLLTKADGSPWRTEPNDIRRPFARAAAAAGVTHATAYSLRHSYVVRQRIAGVPLRSLAAARDASTVVLERVCSANIGDVGDALLRRGLLPEDTAPGGNVVSLAECRA